MKKKHDSPALVLGLFETGLAVGRSLGRNGIIVYGMDFKKDIGSYSRYIKDLICPHPITENKKFVEFLLEFGKKQNRRSVLFITSDDYLSVISVNRDILKEFYYINLPDHELLELVTDKFKQYELAKKNSIPVPGTFKLDSMEDVEYISGQNQFPYFIKAVDVTSWRNEFGGSRKGFEVKNREEFREASERVLKKGIKVIVQEIVAGKDTNHFKVCTYISSEKKMLICFLLQKIRQFPVRFGVGSCVKSIRDKELEKLGKDLFEKIGFTGVGSAEFKLDEKDGKYKLIEINPRYWQQNGLAEKCGMNFPLVHYLDSTGKYKEENSIYREGVKWVNLYMDFSSFLKYRRMGELTFSGWRKSLKGEKIWSDHAWDDIKPGFFEIGFGKKLFKIPKYLLKRR